MITGGTVNVTGTVTVAGRFTGGTLGGAGTPEITGTLEWTGGKMAGPGTTRVAQGGTLILNGISSLTTGRVLENRGLIDVRGSATLFDDFDDPAERVENLGTIRKTAGTSSTLGVPLHNAGVVDGKVGELRIEDGTSEPDTGTFTGTDAANRVVFVGERTFTSAVQLTGSTEIADDITVRAGDTLTLAGTTAYRAGTLRGNVTITGRLNWDGGRHCGPGTTTVAAGGRIVVTPLAQFGCGSASLDGERKLVNNGVLRLEQGADLSTFGEPRSTIENTGRIELETRNDDTCGDIVRDQRRRAAAQHGHDREGRRHERLAPAAGGRQRRDDQRAAGARQRLDGRRTPARSRTSRSATACSCAGAGGRVPRHDDARRR